MLLNSLNWDNVKRTSWENGSFRNKENPQYHKTVLLLGFIESARENEWELQQLLLSACRQNPIYEKNIITPSMILRCTGRSFTNLIWYKYILIRRILFKWNKMYIYAILIINML